LLKFEWYLKILKLFENKEKIFKVIEILSRSVFKPCSRKCVAKESKFIFCERLI